MDVFRVGKGWLLEGEGILELLPFGSVPYLRKERVAGPRGRRWTVWWVYARPSLKKLGFGISNGGKLAIFLGGRYREIWLVGDTAKGISPKGRKLVSEFFKGNYRYVFSQLQKVRGEGERV